MSNSLLVDINTQKLLDQYKIDSATWLTLANSIFPGAKPESIILAVQYCKARNLDILKKPVHIVPMNVTDAQTKQKEYRDIIMPGIYEHRITAMRSGKYAGQDAPEYGPDINLEFSGVHHTVPEFCTVTVYRILEGIKVSFSNTEYFSEAAGVASNGSLNYMWTKRKRGQLAKCAEAGALRKAFPEEIGGLMSSDEINTDSSAPHFSQTVSKTEKTTGPETEAFYSDEDFSKNFPIWEDAIKKGKKTSEEIIKVVSTRAELTAEQINTIMLVERSI